ncbi:hypothetical protein SDC9_182740 [bioreactor metagenome]|uniref:Uncharacterized protein n=1 Tax=bioreactor metagenome TaxID=1076179 RepID=A0A645HHU7_9ZZZZ
MAYFAVGVRVAAVFAYPVEVDARLLHIGHVGRYAAVFPQLVVHGYGGSERVAAVGRGLVARRVG